MIAYNFLYFVWTVPQLVNVVEHANEQISADERYELASQIVVPPPDGGRFELQQPGRVKWASG